MAMKRTDSRFVSLSSLASLGCGLFALASACAGGGGSTPDAASADLASAPDCGVPTIDESVTKPTCTSKPVVASVTDLSGTWVARLATAQVVNAPVVGIMRNVYVLTMLVNISQTGTAIVADGWNCDRKQINEPTALAPVVIPDVWARTETPVHRTGTFAVGNEGYPILHLSAATEVIGAKLSSPTACLPAQSTDQRVYDQDNDGKPGITIALSGVSLAGTLCAVQTQTTVVNAIAVSADRFEGDLRFFAQQNVLESDPPSLGILYSQGVTGPDPVLCNSGFAMVKVGDAQVADGGVSADGGAANSLTCDWVRANEAALFP
jgi:hypothetical protein